MHEKAKKSMSLWVIYKRDSPQNSFEIYYNLFNILKLFWVLEKSNSVLMWSTTFMFKRSEFVFSILTEFSSKSVSKYDI